MKRGTPEHFKLMRLATLLSVERPCDRAEALGIVEALCNHFAPRSAPQGNVGRCTNPEIAAGCYSSRTPDTLVRALVESGWLDESPEYRLTIHDWKDHADESVRKWLKRNKFPWLTASGPCRVVRRMPSRRHLDGIRPPRAGNGNGNGVLVLSSEGKERGAEKGKGVRGAPRRKTPLPEDFALSPAMRAYAERAGLDAEWEFGKFKEYHSGEGTLKLNWVSTWNYWVHRAYEIQERERRQRR